MHKKQETRTSPFTVSSRNTIITEGPVYDKEGCITGYILICAPTDACKIPEGSDHVFIGEAVMMRGTCDEDVEFEWVRCVLHKDGRLHVTAYYGEFTISNVRLFEIP